MKKILIAGESWTTHTIHVKGFDTMTTSTYGEGIKWIRNALKEGGYEVKYIQNHLAGNNFPTTMDEIKEYDVVILSDIGSNTLLLSDSTFIESKKNPNRCDLIKEYVNEGGALCMVGGYMSFTGIDAKARYGETAIADVLPVKLLEKDDRVELPQGINPIIIDKEHEIFSEIEEDWPHFLGYNKTVANNTSQVLATINNDPLIVVEKFGKGKSIVFTSDCAPHWAPPEFIEWKFYNRFWINVMNWLMK